MKELRVIKSPHRGGQELMTDKAFEDILVWDKPKFDLFTWCSDAHGQVPAQVHLVMEIAEGGARDGARHRAQRHRRLDTGPDETPQRRLAA